MFTGYAAGSHYTEKEGSSTYICLPGDPTFRINGPSEGNRAYIWGAEYSFPPNTDGLALQNWDVPCAVCQSAQNGVFMLPGRDDVMTAGWLAAQHITFYHTEFVCMDEYVLTMKIVRYSLQFRPSVVHCHVLYIRPLKI